MSSPEALLVHRTAPNRTNCHLESFWGEVLALTLVTTLTAFLCAELAKRWADAVERCTASIQDDRPLASRTRGHVITILTETRDVPCLVLHSL